jgi:glucose-1-phosphate thymidylyltransferase
MVYYPIRTLVDAGINDILLVTGGQNAGDFLRLLANGEAFGLRKLNYAYQAGEGGIADALRLAEPFTDGGPMCVILGDQIIQNSIRPIVEERLRHPQGAHIVVKEVPDPNRFGVPAIENGRIVRIEEKPEHPASQYAVIGIYFFDHTVFERIARLVPSERGELEVTDLNNSYLSEGQLTYSILDGWWADAGTIESLRLATNLVADSLSPSLKQQEHLPSSTSSAKRT